MNKAIFWIFVMALLFGQVFAAPDLEITNTSTTPSILYPGTQGYLVVTITNNGDTATNAGSVTYSALGSSDSLQIGALAVGSMTTVTMPITISSKTDNGMELVNLDIYYTYTSTSTSTSSSSTSKSDQTGENKISIPLVVEQNDPLEVSNVSFGNQAVSIGEKMPVTLELSNTGGIINNARVSVSGNSSFYMDGGSEKDIGSIASNSSTIVSFTLVTSSDTQIGTYSIPMVVTYQDQLNERVEKNISIGPISVVGPSTTCHLSLEPQSTAEIGSVSDFNLSINNTGASPISAMVVINSTSVFTPVGLPTIYFDSIPAHSTVSKIVEIGISASDSAGYYTLPIEMTTIPGSSDIYDAGIAVTATPEVEVTLSDGEIQVTNVGNCQIRSVDLTATSEGSSTPTESFIGTLNVDDYSTMSLADASSAVNVKITFKDTNDQLHTVTKTLSSGSVADTNRTSTGGAGSQTMGGPGGIPNGSGRSMGLFGPGTTSGSGGINLSLLGGILVVTIAGCYLIYRRFFAKPKPKSVEQKQSK